jgi:hypothetical protein
MGMDKGKKIKDTTPGTEKRPKEARKSILGNADSGTRKNHADQPMSGSLGKKGKGLADMEAAAGNTDE